MVVTKVVYIKFCTLLFQRKGSILASISLGSDTSHLSMILLMLFSLNFLWWFLGEKFFGGVKQETCPGSFHCSTHTNFTFLLLFLETIILGATQETCPGSLRSSSTLPQLSPFCPLPSTLTKKTKILDQMLINSRIWTLESRSVIHSIRVKLPVFPHDTHCLFVI